METTATKKMNTEKEKLEKIQPLFHHYYYHHPFFMILFFFSCVFVFGYARLDWFCLVVLFSCCIWLILLFNENVIFNVFFFCFLIMWITIIQKYIFVFLLRTPCVKISSSLHQSNLFDLFNQEWFWIEFSSSYSKFNFSRLIYQSFTFRKKMNEWMICLFIQCYLIIFFWRNLIQFNPNKQSINQSKQTNKLFFIIINDIIIIIPNI